jgi:2-hydroxyglutarate dehydrogenase
MLSKIFAPSAMWPAALSQLRSGVVISSVNRQPLEAHSQAITYPSTRSLATSSGKLPSYDVAIVGTGIVGLATARQLIMKYPQYKYIVVDKESVIAAHQSGNNSGVIHAGIYYTPGSLKAKLCVEGLRLSYKFCDENNVPYKKCGKLIVATNPEEVSRLDNLYERGLKNDVPDLKVIGPEKIKSIEPNCVGLKALHSPHTGIVDWGLVTRTYAKNFESRGGKVRLGFEVRGFCESTDPEYPVTVEGQNSNVIGQAELFNAKYVITCAGLQSDRISVKSGCSPLPKIVPFRGEYLLLKPEKRGLVNGNIYPCPDPKFPFLGVHFTPRMNGDVWLGPNAVLAFRREGYKLLQFNALDMLDAIAFKGLRKLVLGNMSYAFGELYRGINISAQVKVLQKFVPSLKTSDVTRGPAGVRAQALDEDGKLVDDFIFDSGTGSIGGRMLHVRNAPSPAATSSLAIAIMVADKAKERFRL